MVNSDRGEGPSLEVRRPSGPSPGRRPRDHRHLIGGFSNKTLRPLVASLLGEVYSQARCCYDLGRLRLKGLIVRLVHADTYVLTEDGQRFAVFYTKVHNRLLRPLLAADRPPAPLPVRQALKVLDQAVTDYIDQARIAA